jgi:hypothetical protein
MIPRVLATLPPPRIKLVPPPSQDIRTAALPGYPYRRPPSLLLRGLPSPPLHPLREKYPYRRPPRISVPQAS